MFYSVYGGGRVKEFVLKRQRRDAAVALENAAGIGGPELKSKCLKRR